MERLKISELIEIAERETEKARRSYEAKEPLATEQLQKCLDTLDGLRMMKERGVPDSLKDD